MKTLITPLILAGVLILPWSAANASFCSTYVGTGDCIHFSGNSTTPVPISASAVFEVSGTTLDITLVNDAGSSSTQLGGAEVLTAILFNLSAAGGSLTPTGSSASLTAPLIGTAVLTTASSDSLSQNWALASGINNYFSNQYSVTSTGLSGPPGGQANLGGCTSSGSTACRVLDGPPWGIIPHVNAGGNASGLNPLANYFAFFTLAGLTPGLTNTQLKADLSHVVFQYGTNLGTDSTCLGCGTGNPVPEPSHVVFSLVSSVLIGFVAWRRRRLVA